MPIQEIQASVTGLTAVQCTQVQQLIDRVLDAKTLAPGTDLNSVVENGMYRLDTGHINSPGSAVNYGQMLVIHAGSDTVAQLIVPYNAAGVWVRGGNTYGNPNGKWTSWARVATLPDMARKLDGGWRQVAAENASFTLTCNAICRYGADTRWAYFPLGAGTYTASNALAGGDPANGAVKALWIMT